MDTCTPVNRLLVNNNLNETSTEDFPSFMEQVTTYMTYKIAFYINYYWFPVLFPIGFVGNTLSFLVMIKRNNRKVSTCIYMAAISINDNLLICLTLVAWLVSGPGIIEWNLMMCKAVTYLNAITLQNSRFQVITMTIDKYVAIKWPHRAATYSTPRRATIILTGVFVFTLIFKVPHLFISSLVNGKCSGSAFAADSVVVKVYNWTTVVLSGLIPLAMLTYMNFYIMHIVRKSRNMFKVNMTTTGTRKVQPTYTGMDTRRTTMKNAESQLTIMLLLVTSLFVILLLLLPMYIRIIYLTFVQRDTPSEYASSLLFLYVTYQLLATNNGINFFLYCISGKKFRNDLKEVLCGIGSSLRAPTGTTEQSKSIFTVLASQNTMTSLTLTALASDNKTSLQI